MNSWTTVQEWNWKDFFGTYNGSERNRQRERERRERERERERRDGGRDYGCYGKQICNLILKTEKTAKQWPLVAGKRCRGRDQSEEEGVLWLWRHWRQEGRVKDLDWSRDVKGGRLCICGLGERGKIREPQSAKLSLVPPPQSWRPGSSSCKFVRCCFLAQHKFRERLEILGGQHRSTIEAGNETSDYQRLSHRRPVKEGLINFSVWSLTFTLCFTLYQLRSCAVTKEGIWTTKGFSGALPFGQSVPRFTVWLQKSRPTFSPFGGKFAKSASYTPPQAKIIKNIN